MFGLMKRSSGLASACIFVFMCSAFLSATSSEGQVLEGTVTDSTGSPVAGALISLGKMAATTDDQGHFVLSGMAVGSHDIVISYFGEELARETIQFSGGKLTRDFKLKIDPRITQGLMVTATRTGSQGESILSERVIRRIPAPVTGELLRSLPGVDSVRRGPVGLDPVVQGLRETQVGQYFDGARIFPAGPARMDSGLSHIDPSAINKVQVVKGPYALTWGAGNLSAIRVESFNLDRVRESGLGGSVLGGYHSNTEAQQLSASVFGKSGPVAWWVHGVGREGSDYETGDGVVVPGDMTSKELRGKMRFDLGSQSSVTVDAGYQDQTDVDYPGRILDAVFFETYNLSVGYELVQPGDAVCNISAKLYFNSVDHGMNNDQKPTAQPNPNRMPPFPLQVLVDSQSQVLGGRFAMQLSAGDSMDLELGADFYHTEKDALRTISRRDMGMVMFEDKIWPDAQLTDIGLFGKGSWPFGDRITGEATIRADFIDAQADAVSDFFRDNVSTVTDDSETNLSGALSISSVISEHWTLSLGLGSAVRTADVNERFSDRIPTARAQISSEFVGNPQLNPERSNQVDLWLEGNYSRISLHMNGFYRRIDDYITLLPTNLPRRLPLSPTTVFSYVNGDTEFKGADISLAAGLTSTLDLRVSTAWLEGTDLELDEPAYGISPWSSNLQLIYNSRDKRFSGQAGLHVTGEQDQVSTTRNEAVTPNYNLVDIMAGYTFRNQLTLQLGVVNLTDETYTNHLNARNPYTGEKIPEPGRIVHFNIRYAF